MGPGGHNGILFVVVHVSAVLSSYTKNKAPQPGCTMSILSSCRPLSQVLVPLPLGGFTVRPKSAQRKTQLGTCDPARLAQRRSHRPRRRPTTWRQTKSNLEPIKLGTTTNSRCYFSVNVLCACMQKCACFPCGVNKVYHQTAKEDERGMDITRRNTLIVTCTPPINVGPRSLYLCPSHCGQLLTLKGHFHFMVLQTLIFIPV